MNRRGPFSIHRPRDSECDDTLCRNLHAAHQHLAVVRVTIDKLGSRSSWVGSAHPSATALRPPSALAMVWAVISGLRALLVGSKGCTRSQEAARSNAQVIPSTSVRRPR